MLKSGDVLVVDEKKLAEIAIGTPLADLRQGMRCARAIIEEGEEALGVAVVRIERVGRGRPKKPAFDAVFDGADADKPEGGAA